MNVEYKRCDYSAENTRLLFILCSVFVCVSDMTSRSYNYCPFDLKKVEYKFVLFVCENSVLPELIVDLLSSLLIHISHSLADRRRYQQY